MKTSFYKSQFQMPAVIESDKALTADQFLDFVQERQEELKDLLNSCGAVYFKGFNQSVESFNAFVDILCPDAPLFNSRAPGIFVSKRKSVAKNAVETTYLDKRLPMAMHNEFNYLPCFPRYLFFRCIKAPYEGGETAIADYRKVYNQIDPAVREKFEQRGIKYIRNFYTKRPLSDFINKFIRVDESWMRVFNTDSKQEVEAICKEFNMSFYWGKNGYLHTETILPAVRTHPDTGEKVWFNQGAQMVQCPQIMGWLNHIIFQIIYPVKNTVPNTAAYGDGTSISVEDALHIKEVIDRNTVKVKWAEGDTLVCDNYLVAHTRIPYKGERSLAGAMRA